MRPPPLRVGVLFVHGVGNASAGRTLATFTAPVLGVLARFCPTITWAPGPVPNAAAIPLHGRSELSDQKGRTVEVVFAEAHWANPRARERLSSFLWLSSVVPLMLLLALAPDYDDIVAFRGQRSSDSGMALLWPRTLARLLWRVLLLGLLVALASLKWYVLVALLAVVVAVGVAQTVNVLGDVHRVLPSRASRTEVLGVLQSSLKWLESQTDSVIVVGHSQGGYLSYTALQQRSHPGRVRELYGIGSGLKPISALAAATRTARCGALLILGGLVALFVSLAPTIALVVVHSVQYVLLAGRVTVDSMVANRFVPLQHVDMRYILRQTAWMNRPLFVILAWVAMAVAYLPVRQLLRSTMRDRLTAPGRLDAWVEASTRQDTVGRLHWPATPGCAHVTVPGLADSVYDHISYFQPGGTVPYLIAHAVLTQAHFRRDDRRRLCVERGAVAEVVSARQTRRVCALRATGAVTAAAFLTLTVNPLENGLDVLQRTDRVAWVPALGLLAGAMLLVVRARRERRVVARALGLDAFASRRGCGDTGQRAWVVVDTRTGGPAVSGPALGRDFCGALRLPRWRSLVAGLLCLYAGGIDIGAVGRLTSYSHAGFPVTAPPELASWFSFAAFGLGVAVCARYPVRAWTLIALAVLLVVVEWHTPYLRASSLGEGVLLCIAASFVRKSQRELAVSAAVRTFFGAE